MRNNGLFSTIFISEVKQGIKLDDRALGRMATLGQTWRNRDYKTAELLWNSFMKQALSYLQFVPPNASTVPGVYSLYEDWAFSSCLSVLYLIEPGADIDDTAVGRFWPAKLLKELRKQNLNWGILTDGAKWRLYSTKSSRPYEDFVELSLAEVLEKNDEDEYGLFEQFFHKDSFVPEESKGDNEGKKGDEGFIFYKCRLDRDKEASEKLLGEYVKKPLLYQIDEILQYLCNGFIADTTRRGDEYTEEERREIFESSVKLLYRCLFLFYAEARRLLPSEVAKVENYSKHSIRALCREAHKFQWGKRKDYDGFDLWKHLKGLTNAVNDGDTDYGIMGYNGGLFDDEQEKFLGRHRLRNDSLSRALYLLAYVEPYNNNPDDEHEIPYEDLEVRHLGELYENILEYTVLLADADHIRRRTKKGVEVLLASEATRQKGDTLIKKGDVYFGETALERKQTGSYYTPDPLVRFLNTKAVVDPLRERFEKECRTRFNEFLEQASSGQDEGTRRGAVRSAVAIVERFVNDVVLDFKVCDLTMGSGHFLVDAANQMAGLVVELLAEIPNVKGLSTKVTSNPNDWRRLITRNCLYGVDLNPLAVDLAKLSLWLNCFAIDHKLTFLDHHLRCGNSLIGIRTLDQLKIVPKRKYEKVEKSKQQLLPYFDDLSKILTQTSKTIEAILDINEDDTDRQKTVFEKAHESAFARLAPLADLYTAFLMDNGITEAQYRESFSHFASGRNNSKIVDEEFKNLTVKVQDYKQRHQFFHWALEFPDVFKKDGEGGFNATIGNPPWNVLQPNTQEFYVPYIPEFRKYKKQEAIRRISELHIKHSEIAERWQNFEGRFKEASAYFKNPEAFQCLNEGKIDLYKAFLERFFQIVRTNGKIGILAPSGLYTDQGCQSLRELFFRKTRIEFLYCFENRRGIFNIHRSFKFVVFSAKKGDKTDEFKCAFLEHDPERLPAIHQNALTIKLGDVRTFSPYNLSIMEFSDRLAVEITSKIYGNWPLLKKSASNSWNVEFTQEFNMTSDSQLFLTKDDLIKIGAKFTQGYRWIVSESNDPKDLSLPAQLNSFFKNHIDLYLPLYEGKNIHEFDSNYQEPQFYVSLRSAISRQKEKHLSSITYPKVIFRALGQSGNERNCIACVLPEGCFSGNSVYYSVYHESEFEELQILFFQAWFTSFVIDYLIRQKIDKNLRLPFLDTLPLPRLKASEPRNKGFFWPLVSRCVRLSCVSSDFSSVWNSAFIDVWRGPAFWYPKSPISIDSYGPKHEQEIRQSLVESVSELTEHWSPPCGIYDRTENRRDRGDRAQLRAEIDAYVAHLYGLTRDEFAHILDTFPVLKRKEEEAFGEYMSKRKCLEEYDRVRSIL